MTHLSFTAMSSLPLAAVEDLFSLVSWVIPILILGALLLPQMIRILREYERGVVFRLGKLIGTKGPGLVILIPVIDKMVKMDLRVVTVDVNRQEIMTCDNVPVTVDAVVFFRVVSPESAVIKVENFWRATGLIAQTTLRSVLGQSELDELLSKRDQINATLQEVIDKQTDNWGVKVTAVEVRDVQLPESMRRAMARQAESERDRRAKVINAEGEYQAAEKLTMAAKMISAEPIALQLRFLQTMVEISGENNTTTFLPLPIEIFRPFMDAAAGKGGGGPMPTPSEMVESGLVGDPATPEEGDSGDGGQKA